MSCKLVQVPMMELATIRKPVKFQMRPCVERQAAQQILSFQSGAKCQKLDAQQDQHDVEHLQHHRDGLAHRIRGSAPCRTNPKYVEPRNADQHHVENLQRHRDGLALMVSVSLQAAPSVEDEDAQQDQHHIEHLQDTRIRTKERPR